MCLPWTLDPLSDSSNNLILYLAHLTKTRTARALNLLHQGGKIIYFLKKKKINRPFKYAFTVKCDLSILKLCAICNAFLYLQHVSLAICSAFLYLVTLWVFAAQFVVRGFYLQVVVFLYSFILFYFYLQRSELSWPPYFGPVDFSTSKTAHFCNFRII